MTLKELIKMYKTGNGEETMWKSVDVISEYIENHKDEHEDEYAKLKNDV